MKLKTKITKSYFYIFLERCGECFGLVGKKWCQQTLPLSSEHRSAFLSFQEATSRHILSGHLVNREGAAVVWLVSSFHLRRLSQLLLLARLQRARQFALAAAASCYRAPSSWSQTGNASRAGHGGVETVSPGDRLISLKVPHSRGLQLLLICSEFFFFFNVLDEEMKPPSKIHTR